MGKIKAWYRSIPIWLAIFLFAAAALIACTLVSNKVVNMAGNEMAQITMKYMDTIYSTEIPEDFHTETSKDNSLVYHSTTGDDGIVISHYNIILALTEEDAQKYGLYRGISQYAPAVTYSVGLLIAVLLVYFSKLKKPLAMLLNASGKIAENQFDFSLDYSGHDELARLCGAFEKMRSSVNENNMRMRQIIEERKQLNDAYTHDLRTPIAVLKGYTDTLCEYLPTGQLTQEKVLETVHTMSTHVERLEQFVNSMNTAQKLADLTIRREAIPTEDFVCGLRETTTLLCEKKNLSCEINSNMETDTLNIDPLAVTQVFENLLNNALRFAKTKIVIQIEGDGQALTIRMTDDGRGFAEKELSTAAKPYYCGQQTEKTYHFGLGLYISQTLCEKHGGSLKLANAVSGGASVTAIFHCE